MNIYSLKNRLIQYRIDHPYNRNKVITDQNLKQDLINHPEYQNYPINEKAALIILGFVPKCECGNLVKYQGKNKSGVNSTPFGGWLEFCSFSCARTSPKTIARRKSTIIEKYGVDSWAKTEEAKAISTATWSETKKENYNKNV